MGGIALEVMDVPLATDMEACLWGNISDHHCIADLFFVQAQKTKGLSPKQDESNLDILKKRYAMGEIAKEEYERIKKELEG